MPFQTIELTEKDQDLLVKILEKRIYLGITDVFSEELNKALSKKFNQLIIDLQNVSVMNSSGIGELIKARDILSKQGKTIRLINLQPLMSDIFSRMRLDTLFEIEK
jgi:anti-anti-sigma factor